MHTVALGAKHFGQIMPERDEEYVVHVTRRGTASKPFGWAIVRKADGHKVARSLETFSARTEALADSSRTAASMAFNPEQQPHF
jgi:hypothetical protein